ncbi:MAG: XdhC family protein [Myxococcota bacterium]
MRAELLEELLALRASQTPVVVATELETGSQTLLRRDDVGGEPARRAAVERALDTDCAITVGGVFYHPHNPPLRLVVVGAVHVTQSLVVMAGLAGYVCTIVEPRAAFARPERFPRNTDIRVAWPEDVIPDLKLDARAAVITLTHDPKIDDPALEAALRTPAFYIGALGSRTTHARRRQRLAELGFSRAQLARVHGPIGLDLGGRAPAEIAVATLAEMVAVLRRGETSRER